MITTNPIAVQRNSTVAPANQQAFEAIIQSRLGVVPNAFKGEAGSFKVKEKMWETTEFSYIDNPLPSLFKERLFVYLSTFCKTRYCLVRHVGFLTGSGYPAGDHTCSPQSAEDVLALLRFKLPMEASLKPYINFCLSHKECPAQEIKPNSFSEQAIFACAAHLYLQSDQTKDCTAALKKILGTAQFEWLIVLLNFIHSTHLSASVNAELFFEGDVVSMMHAYKQIAACLLKAPEVYPAAITKQMLDDLSTLQTSVRKYQAIKQDFDILVKQYNNLHKKQKEQQVSLQRIKELQQQAQLLELIHDPVIVWNLDGSIAIWNTGAQTHYGYTKEEAAGQVIHTLLQTNGPLPADDIVSIVVKKGEWFGELEHTLKNGTTIVVESRQRLFKLAGKKCILETNHDITERRKAQEQLSISEEKYRTLFESIDEGFCIIDVLFDAEQKPCDYRFIEMNPAFERHTGFSKSTSQGRRMKELVTNHEQHWFDVYGQVALTGQPVRLQNKADALNRYYDVYAFKIGAAEERKVAVLFNDITHRKQLEQQREEFLNIASHELKTPVTSIKAYAEILQEIFQENGDSGNAGMINKMNAQVDRLTNLIKALLDNKGASEGHLLQTGEKFILNGLIAEKVEALQKLAG